MDPWKPSFDFRCNNCIPVGIRDAQRAVNLVLGVVGKRLTYRRADT